MTLVTLRSFFSQFGPVIDATIARDKDTGRPTVFGFVEFESRDDACAAIEELDGVQLEEGRTINVTWAISSKPPGREVMFRSLPADTTSRMLRNVCGTLGKITCIDLAMDQFTARFKHYAFVHFASDGDAIRVIDELDGFDLGGGAVRVQWSMNSCPPGSDLLVRFLPLGITSKSLRHLFAQFGRVVDVDLKRNFDAGEKTAHAFVRFEREAYAAKAIDELDGFVMNGTSIRICWAKASIPKGVNIRLSGLDADVDRRLLKRLFERFDGIRSIEVEYSRTTAESLGFGHITFGSTEQAESAIAAFGGRLLSRGWTIDLPKALVERELERIALMKTSFTQATSHDLSPNSLTNSKGSVAAMADDEALNPFTMVPTNIPARITLTDLTVSSTSTNPESEDIVVDSADAVWKGKWQRPTSIECPSSISASHDVPVRQVRANFIQDLLTDRWMYIPTGSQAAADSPVAATEDLISFVDAPPTLSHVVNELSDDAPVAIGSIHSTKSGRSILVKCCAVAEDSKADKVVDILTRNASEQMDPNHNTIDTRILKTTLVVTGLVEMRTYVDRLLKAGIDCFMCADNSVRGGHSWHPTQGISAHVAEPPLADNVIFVRPSSDVATTLDLLRTRKSTISVVSVLSDEDSPLQSSEMALLEGRLFSSDD